MKEIRIAVNNTLLCLDSYINDLECDVNMLRELEIAYRDKKEYAIEKAYKEIICQNLINFKKELIDIVNIDKHAENCMKDFTSKHTADLSATRGESEEQ